MHETQKSGIANSARPTNLRFLGEYATEVAQTAGGRSIKLESVGDKQRLQFEFVVPKIVVVIVVVSSSVVSSRFDCNTTEAPTNS
jgi:hypothetical protein